MPMAKALFQSPREPPGSRTRETSADDDGIAPDQVADGGDDMQGYDSDHSDAESFTLKDRQDAINETHPFGIRIWKPALYKKSRSVQQTARGATSTRRPTPASARGCSFSMSSGLLSLAGGWPRRPLRVPLSAFSSALLPAAAPMGACCWDCQPISSTRLATLSDSSRTPPTPTKTRAKAGSISEYEQWQNGDLEDGRLFFGPLNSRHQRGLVGRRRSSLDSAGEGDSLLGRTGRRPYDDDDFADDGEPAGRNKRRLFGRGPWNIGRVIFFIFFYGLIAPLLLLVSGACWLMVFWIPMGKVTLLLFYHLRRHPARLVLPLGRRLLP